MSCDPSRPGCNLYGISFSIAKQFLEPPRYRFQALQDADHAALQGNYSEALSLYAQVISDQKLEWWSEERQAYDFYSRYPEAGTPTPTQPAPDPNEYASLAAYARFRMAVIYLLQGKSSQAESTFSDLQTQAQVGIAGQPDAQMAKAFWDTYQATEDIGQACDSAVAFAAQHPTEILYYIGGNYHGWQSPIYQPPDTCPFR
jgi:hypothetical protein